MHYVQHYVELSGETSFTGLQHYVELSGETSFTGLQHYMELSGETSFTGLQHYVELSGKTTSTGLQHYVELSGKTTSTDVKEAYPNLNSNPKVLTLCLILLPEFCDFYKTFWGVISANTHTHPVATPLT